MGGAPRHDDDDIAIVREGAGWVVVSKPSGMLSVPGKGPEKADCVASRVRARSPDSDGPLIVHRLDMDTSGLLVLGLTASAQRALSMQFEARTVGKAYEALVEGRVEGPAGGWGEVRLAMRLDPDNRPVQVVDPARGKDALTRWRALGVETLGGRPVTRVAFEPVTGRSHQLRVHAAHPDGLGAPIVGDPLYGPDGAAPGERLMLHARWLAFDDPGTGERVEAADPVPF